MLGVEASSIIVIPVFVALVPLDVPVLYIIIFVEGVIGITRRPEVDSFLLSITALNFLSFLFDLDITTSIYILKENSLENSL